MSKYIQMYHDVIFNPENGGCTSYYDKLCFILNNISP